MKSGLWWSLKHWLGVPEHGVSLRERAVATGTSVLGLLVVAFIAHQCAPAYAAHQLWLVASIGATAVLVFAVPHGPLSQPWAVLGGQGLSALVGVAVAHTLGGGFFAAGLAVGGAIGLMHSLRCIHPPGGATALSAVSLVGSAHPAGWDYVLTPVLLNSLVIVGMAILLNAPFEWRRYPAAWAARRVHPATDARLAPEPPFSQKQLLQALQELESVVDITDEELAALYESLRRQQTHEVLRDEDLVVGAFYSNGQVGEGWSVRRIIDASEPNAKRAQLIVKTIAGQGRGETRLMARHDFLKWGRYRVRPNESAWERLES